MRVVLRQSAYGPDAATADIRGTTAKAGSCGWYESEDRYPQPPAHAKLDDMFAMV